MKETQKSKLIDEIPELDIVIIMGCDIECTYLPCKYREERRLDDLTGKSDEKLMEIINIIERKIFDLKNTLL